MISSIKEFRNRHFMMRYIYLPTLITLFWTASLSAQTLVGTITDPAGVFVQNARITLFNADTSYFRETRTNANGQYLFENLPAGGPYLFFGVAKPGYAYFENATTGIIGTVTHDAQLALETNPGQWATIVDSPEPLGGTDLGVLLPDGRIYYCHNTKDPFVFDPVANDTFSIAGDTKIQGCVAAKLLWNGKILMAGGTEMDVYGPGTQKIKQFEYATQSWQPLPNMLDYRWYPSLTQLSDGKLLIVGGGGLNNPIRVNSSELYDPIAGTTLLADTVAIRMEQSPILTLYNGKALMTFRPPQLFDPFTKQWELAADFVQGNRMPNGDHVDHELVHLPEGDVIAIGYKPFPAGTGGNLVERYTPNTNTWSLQSHFAPLRSRSETVLTPDRRILVIAGAKEDPNDPTPVNQWGYMDLTDQYDPYGDTWRRLAAMPRKREYHALAVLVPDGRVIVVGGEGQPGNEPPKSIIDAYQPPYLFRGVRPKILNLTKTDFQRGESIAFDVARTNAPTAVVLQSAQAVTHMMNCGENRFLDLNFSIENQSVVANIPDDSLKVLPGWYMLWVMVDDIPSQARMVRILPGKPTPIETPPLASFTATPTTGCVPLSVQFVSTSSANATSLSWQFTGVMPDTSTAQNPSVSYANAGTYLVRLTASNAVGIDSFEQIITVNPLPVATFDFLVSGKTVDFSNLSQNAETLLWNFGDGNSSTETNPSHVYAANGTYVVTLVVMNDCGTSTIEQSITILTIGTEEADGAESFRLYPNPAVGSLVWEVSDALLHPEIIQLLDAQGRICRTWSSAPLPKALSTLGLPSGVYFFKLKTAQRVFTRKVVLQH